MGRHEDEEREAQEPSFEIGAPGHAGRVAGAAAAANAAAELMFRLRSELLRKHWGLSSSNVEPELAAAGRCRIGTKLVLEEYLSTVTDALNFLAELPDPRSVEEAVAGDASCAARHTPGGPNAGRPRDDLGKGGGRGGGNLFPYIVADRLTFFNETRHAFGRSALCFSGGASMGLCRCRAMQCHLV